MSGLRLLTRASEILEAEDIARETVPTPEWGEGTGVLVQAMNATQRFAFEQAGFIFARDARGNTRVDFNQDHDRRLALVVCSVVDEAGNPVFSKGDVEALAEKNAAPLDRIADVARRLSRLRAEDDEELGDRLKAASGGSPSASPSPSA